MHRWIILLNWGQVFVTAFSLDIILKFSKTVILEFSNSPTQMLVFFLSRKTVGRVTRTKYFLDGRPSTDLKYGASPCVTVYIEFILAKLKNTYQFGYQGT